MNAEDIYVYDPAFEDYPSSEDSDLPGGRASSDPSTLQNSLESFASDPNIVSALNENIDLTEYGITLDEKLTVAEGKAVEQYSAKGDDLEDLQSSIGRCILLVCSPCVYSEPAVCLTIRV